MKALGVKQMKSGVKENKFWKGRREKGRLFHWDVTH